MVNTSSENFFKDINDFGCEATSDPLDEWLTTPVIKSVRDPMVWWYQNREWNALAVMALDILSSPGKFLLCSFYWGVYLHGDKATSTEVECAFSRGGLTVSKHRHNLLDESTHAATVLSSWANIEGLIPEANIVKMFRDKSKRKEVVNICSALSSDVSIID